MKSTKLNLINADRKTFEDFTTLLVNLAFDDQRAMRGPRSGRELCERFCDEWRKGHARLASTVYSKVRWSLSSDAREAAAAKTVLADHA